MSIEQADRGSALKRRLIGGLIGMLVLATAGGTWIGYSQWQAQPLYSQHHATAPGQSRTVSLPDGSELQLDSSTRLQVNLYRDRRVLRLTEGQVQLQLQTDPARPFTVLAGPLRVIGQDARFVVRRTPSLGEAGASVAVTQGSVDVIAQRDDAPRGPVQKLVTGQSIAAAAAGTGLMAIEPVAPAAR